MFTFQGSCCPDRQTTQAHLGMALQATAPQVGGPKQPHHASQETGMGAYVTSCRHPQPQAPAGCALQGNGWALS
jgi:hypothetical protein